MKERWEKLLSFRRPNGESLADEVFEPARNPFVIDQDRITFSSSFRRLSKKTQVHPLSRNDHIHNRLTHSMEVASVARSIAVAVGWRIKEKGHLPDIFSPDHLGHIVQAACQAHDIGNPPFGHAGESAIQDWFHDPANHRYIKDIPDVCQADFRLFDGNAQGFRVVNALENNKDKGGLRLTSATLGALVKYPVSAYEANGRGKKKFNYYQSEKNIFTLVFDELGLRNGSGYARHPLSYITEAADDICYRIVDIEDARELKILSFKDMLDVTAPLHGDMKLDPAKFEALDSDRRRASMLRTMVVGTLIQAAAQAFDDNYDAILTGSAEKSLIALCHERAVQYMENAKNVFNGKIKNEPQKIALEIGTYSMYRTLLNVFIPACYGKIKENGENLSYKDERALDLMGVNRPAESDDLYTGYLRVIDFITGMTDNYATFLAEQFSGSGTGK
ncbi:deoxyguanosinetriphosphate triphosphohydrolase [Desulfovibrio sp. OttesenSCG-928-I05]|nr:deoxyguanosinetriphosphate triphosphohydrolase [Desulfovibrio sp. OttesenSCG-928-I05]